MDNFAHRFPFQLSTSKSFYCCFLSCIPAPQAPAAFSYFQIQEQVPRPHQILFTWSLCPAEPHLQHGHASLVGKGSPQLPELFPQLSCRDEREGECRVCMWHFPHHKSHKYGGALWMWWELIIAFFQVLSFCSGGF